MDQDFKSYFIFITVSFCFVLVCTKGCDYIKAEQVHRFEMDLKKCTTADGGPNNSN